MKFLKIIGLILTVLIAMALVTLAQTADTTAILKLPTVPEGFNWLYIPLFAVGLLIHYGVKVFHDLGSAKFFSGFLSNFPGWFVNKFHYTLLSGAAVAIMALASTYELSISFAVINTLGVVASIAAGYIGDSAFNSGKIV
jgi:uncharacterized membrane protein